MANIQIINKDSQQVVFEASSSRVLLTAPSVIKIQANITDVVQIKRIANDAIVELKNGEKIVISDFFAVSAKTNALVFEDASQQLTWVQFTRGSSNAQVVYYDKIDSLAAVLDQGSFHFSPWTYALGGAVLVGGVAAAVSDGGSNSSADSSSPPASSTLRVTENDANALAGTATAGTTIEVTINGVKQSTIANATGQWRIQPNPIAENQKASITEKTTNGTVVATIEVTRPDGAPATPTVAASVSDDQAPVVGNVADKSTTNDNLPRLSGTASKGDIITIYDNGVAIGSTTVADSGTWSFTPSTVLSDGQHVLTYTAKDTGGKESGKSPSITIIVDTLAEQVAANPATITDDVQPFTGTIANGGSTNAARPTVSGAGTPGETINIYVDGVLNGSTTVSTDGSWRYVPAGALADGTHAIRFSSVDTAGNESEKSPAVNITVDTSRPVATLAAMVTDNTAPILGNVANNGQSNDARPTFSGTASAGDTVTILDNDKIIGSVTASGTGAWSFSPSSALSEGSHSISYTLTDPAGNQSASAAPSIVFNVDTTAPNAVLSIRSISDDTDIAGDFITADTSLTLTGGATGLASNERVQISIDAGATWSDLTVSGGTWSYVDSRVLTNGAVQYWVRAVDAAGNTSTVVSKTVGIDTSLSIAAIAITAISDDSGLVGDFVTNDSTLTVSGTVANLNSSQKAQISLDNGASWIDLSVNNGLWNYNDNRVLSEGGQLYRVRVLSSANSVVATAAQLVTVDSTAPTNPTAAPTITDDAQPIVGNIVNGTVSNDAQPIIAGTGAVSGSVVIIYDNNSVLGSVVAAEDGSWRFTPDTALSDRQHLINYAYRDTAGNESARSATVNFSVDQVAPSTPTSAPSVTDGLAPNTGNLSAGSSSNDTRPIISGIAAVAGEIIHVYDADRLIGSTTVVAGGSWSFSPTTALSEGTHQLSYTRTDAAGNVSNKSPSIGIVIDTTAPLATIQILSITDDTGVAGDFKTADRSVSINGRVIGLGSDERLQLSLDGQTWNDITVSAGNWSYSDTRTLTDGSYNYQVRAIDAAGNVSSAVSQLVTIDGTQPAAAIRIISMNEDTGIAGDYVTSDNTITLNGNVAGLTAGQKAQISLDNGQNWIDLTLNTNNWSYSDVRILAEGNYNYLVRVVSSTGAAIGVSDSRSITIDTTAPAAPTAAFTITDDQAPNLGNITTGSISNDAQPTLSGSGLGANVLVSVLDNGVVIGSTNADSNGNWRFSPSSALSEGVHLLAYAVHDLAGNLSAASSTVNFIVDTAAPVATIRIDSISDDTGNAGDFITADNTLTINGSANGLLSGEKLQISLDGSTWLDLNLTSAADNSTSSWQYVDARTLANGVYTYSVRAIDLAGNVSAPVSRQVTVDNTAPTAAIRINSISDDTGVVGDLITNDTSLSVNGSVTGLKAGEKAQISVDGQTWQNLNVVNDAWRYTDSRVLSNGTVTYLVRVLNSTETAVGATAALNVLIDTTAPSYSHQVAILRDLNNDGFINASEKNSANTSDVSITLSSSAQQGDVITVKNADNILASYTIGQDGVTAGSRQQITGVSLPNEGESLSIRVETRDVAGNLSAVISSDVATLNSSATNPVLQQGSAAVDTLTGNSNNNWFEAREGNDIINLDSLGGQDSLFYNVLNSNDATGGNGVDVVNQFTVGNSQTNLEADKIDLKALLINYTADADGAAHFINGVASIDSGDAITQYLSVQNNNGNSTLLIDRDGVGATFNPTALLTLSSVNVDLATLLANHQIVLG